MASIPFLKLIPEYRDYVWGGERLRPGHNPTAEAWVVWEGDQIENGAFAGKTLSEVSFEYGTDILGKKAFARTGVRFPLLVKLLDCKQWLSLQVHPNDEQAVLLEGPGHFGKTEAWHVLDAMPDAKLIAGVKPGVTSLELADSIHKGTITKHSHYAAVSAGDTVFMPAGTLHALGPGLFIYEVQQTSDITYRVYDWGRPETGTRRLHMEQSIQITRPDFSAPVIPQPDITDGSSTQLAQCDYFALDLLSAAQVPIHLDTLFESFHAITVIEGKARLHAEGNSIILDKLQSVLVPACIGKYEFEPMESCSALKSSVG